MAAPFEWGAHATGRDHGRREIRTLKILMIEAGIDFPHAAQALQIRRCRHRLDQPKRFTTETVYAITDLLSPLPENWLWLRFRDHLS